ncbi:unnamed protein product [Adineta steineri]|uniref:EF-hand domain-containing protein n=1 Tax=Adineta steineri TaxID=433720 RepID=A0A820JB00_9BILA|nr:unnamed protein product [Adineta steineri]
MADDRRTRNVWVSGLKHLIDSQAQKRQRNLIRDTNWILSHVRCEDKDKSNTMNKSECKKFLAYSLNVELSEDSFEKNFQKVNKNGDGNLTPNEFIEFFHILTRRKDLYEIMQKYVKNGDDQSIETICMTTNELLHFLQTVQNQKLLNYPSKQSKDNFTVQSIMTRKQVQELINEYEPNIELQKKSLLSLDGFRNLLSSDDFCIMQPWCSRRTYQDMTR